MSLLLKLGAPRLILADILGFSKIDCRHIVFRGQLDLRHLVDLFLERDGDLAFFRARTGAFLICAFA